MLVSLSLMLLAAAPQEAAAVPPVRLAMTRSGVMVEAALPPAAGALEIQTAFGVFRTPLDPVEVVLERPAETWPDPGEVAGQARASAGARELHMAVRRLEEEGRLRELATLTEALAAHPGPGTEDALVQAAEALVRWGARLDPAPPELELDRRVDWLWEELRRRGGARALLLTGRLQEEVDTGLEYHPRQVPLADLRRALRSRDPWLRAAAARLAGWQRFTDEGLLRLLFAESLRAEHLLVRAGAAAGLAASWLDYALPWWFDAACQSLPEERRTAVAWLARFGGTDGLEALFVLLSAWDKHPPHRWTFLDVAFQSVRGVREPSVALLPDDGVIALHPGEEEAPGRRVLAGAVRRSVIRVTVFPEGFAGEVLARIRESGHPRLPAPAESEGWKIGDWLRWFAEKGLRGPVQPPAAVTPPEKGSGG